MIDCCHFDIFPGELIHVFELTKPKIVVVSAYAQKKILEACRQLSFIEKVILIDGETIDDYAVSFKDLLKKYESAKFNVEEQVAKKIDMADQVGVIMCSSGTTGLPKGVQITQLNIKSSIDGYREIVDLITKQHGVPCLKLLNIAPLFHVLAFMNMCVFTFIGDPINVLLPRFDETAFLKAVQVS